ncbi:MAG: glycosyltransferase family 2 protein [Gammaproteobacteria bacterium]|nr:glycosyltransferase family 2 protein [Gammaproteobacteria bacterium]MDH3464346.1 glycosyltransferase family 2 protein [Gammaproteobacteria bacterium]
MLVFITSIRHPRNCNSYDRVVQLLDQTLNSVCAQTSINYHVVVVANKTPDLVDRKNVHFVEVTFPPPSELEQPNTGMQAIRVDRGSKYVVGLIYAKRFMPDYIMFFDADDYISRRIVEFVEQNPTEDGWYFEHGYRYKYGSDKVTLLDEFNKACGTSHIIRYSLFEIPKELTVGSPLSSIEDKIDSRYLNFTLGSHRFARRQFREIGVTLSALPFPGAVWVLGNGENHSGKKGRPGDLPLTDRIREEFTLYEPATIAPTD